jgi:hypothetical protein
MSESRTVTIGLDVHASSIRLAAIRGDELLEERTLPYDCQALERVLPCGLDPRMSADPPSLPRAYRCLQPRGQPQNRGSPLDVLLHVRRRLSPDLREKQSAARENELQEISDDVEPRVAALN